MYAPDSNLLYVAEWSCVLVTKDMSLKPTSVPGLLPVFTFEGWAGKEDAFPRNFWQYSGGSNTLFLHLNDIFGVPGVSREQKETSRIVSFSCGSAVFAYESREIDSWQSTEMSIRSLYLFSAEWTRSIYYSRIPIAPWIIDTRGTTRRLRYRRRIRGWYYSR